MKRIFFTIYMIPLVIVSQGVFAASYMHGGQGYTTYSTSSQFLQNNNNTLRNEVCDYNRTLPENTKKLERSSSFEVQQNDGDFSQQKTSSPDSERKQETPDWWRQPGSLQGWGLFN